MADNGVDVSIAPNSSVTLEPADSLSFHLQPQAAPQAVLTIRNVSNDRKIAFKVKTTRPLRYLVRPNQGLLGANGSASIMVILQQKDCDELLRLEPSERQLANDKFLVQSIYVEDSFYELVKTKSTKEMADELTNMWARTDKKSLSNKKLRCRFVQQQEEEQPVAATTAPVTAATLANEPPMLRYQSKGGSLYSSSSSFLTKTGAEEPPVAAVAAEVEVSTPAQLSSALLQETSTDRLANSTKTDVPATKDSMQEVATLRKKYDELLQKATNEAQRAKKLTDEASGPMLRQRRTGAGATGNSNEDSSVITGKGGKDQAAFGLFHLLVCAIIFFLVGRYY